MERKTKKVLPCGMLYSQGREYFAIEPAPLDSYWDTDFESVFRWVVVPNKPIDTVRKDIGESWIEEELYSYPRHIVSNSFTIEYASGLPEILVWDWRLEDD